jgi:hypothetical protein
MIDPTIKQILHTSLGITDKPLITDEEMLGLPAPKQERTYPQSEPDQIVAERLADQKEALRDQEGWMTQEEVEKIVAEKVKAARLAEAEEWNRRQQSPYFANWSVHHLATLRAALASPPASESERELGPCGKHPKVFWVEAYDAYEENEDGPEGRMVSVEAHCTVCEELRPLVEALQHVLDIENFQSLDTVKYDSTPIREIVERAIARYQSSPPASGEGTQEEGK